MDRNNLFPDGVTIRSRGYLPHWERDNSFYSVTIRLGDSIPSERLGALIEGKNRQKLKCTPDYNQRYEIELMFERELDRELHRDHGSCALARPEIAQLVCAAFHYFDGTRYTLITYALMPNHAHLVFKLERGSMLANVLHSWKSYTAKRALAITGDKPPFWQREYYDRLIRNETDLRHTRRYVLDNPAEAGLKHWKWVYDIYGGE